RLAKAWYFVAALLVAPQIFLIWTSGTVSENLADAVICALGGYFLGARRSRAVAVSLFIYTLAVITMAFAAKWGARGGTNIILALAFLAIGWRSMQATWTYHRVHGLRTAWKRVLAISGLAALASVIMLAAVVLLEIWLPQYLGDEALTGLLPVASILLAVLAIMWPLTRRYPFAYSAWLGGRNSQNISEVFD